MTSRLIAPGVDDLTSYVEGSQTVTGQSVEWPSYLTPVNPSLPPFAYGGQSGGLRSTSKKTSSVDKGSAGLTADTFLAFSSLPFLPSEAPQRVSFAARFRADKKFRVPVTARSPPTVGILAVTGDGGDEIKTMAVNGDGGMVFVASESGSGVYLSAGNSYSRQPNMQAETLPPTETRLYSEIFESSIPSVTAFQGGEGILSADFCPDSPLIATGGLGGTVGLWSIEKGKQLVSYSGHTSRTPVWTTKFCPASTYFLSGGGDGAAKLYRSDIPCFLRSLPHSMGRHVTKIAWHPNAQVAVTVSDEELVLWDLLSPRRIGGFSARGVRDVAFSPSGNFMTVAGGSGGLSVYDMAMWAGSEENSQQIFYSPEPASKVAWSWPTSSGSLGGLVSVDGSGRARLFDKIVEGRPSVCELPLERPIRPFAVQFTCKNFLLVAGVDQSAVVIDQ